MASSGPVATHKGTDAEPSSLGYVVVFIVELLEYVVKELWGDILTNSRPRVKLEESAQLSKAWPVHCQERSRIPRYKIWRGAVGSSKE